MNIKGYAAFKPKDILKEFEYEVNAIKQNEVLVKITHCGISRGDINFINDAWGGGTFPLIAGHEIIGIVEEKGSDVASVEIGERVGIGYEVKSCMNCEYCKKGEENFCMSQEVLCFNHFGGFAEKIVVDSNFVFKIPENLDSARTAPLMSAGLTVYSAFDNYKVSSLDKVGVIGIGGLGHLAIQFAHALGANVTAFSHNPSKKKQIQELGADEFVQTTDSAQMNIQTNKFDFILSTTTATDADWKTYIKMLKPTGKLCIVGLPLKEVSFPATLLADFAQKTVCGSYIGSRKQTNEMLDFASKHNIGAFVNIYQMKEINQAIEDVENGQVPFRGVVTNE